MDLLTERQTSFLALVDACNTSGYRPTNEEVLLWLRSPEPRALTTTTVQRLRALRVPASHAGILAQVDPGTGEDDVDQRCPLPVARPRPGPGPDAARSALLLAGARTRTESTKVDVLPLGRDDPLAYPRLVASSRRPAQGSPSTRTAGAAPRRRHRQEVDRVLVSKQHKDGRAVRAGIATYLGSSGLRRPVQVRASEDSGVHNRMFVASDGTVHLLWTSLNAVKASPPAPSWSACRRPRQRPSGTSRTAGGPPPNRWNLEGHRQPAGCRSLPPVRAGLNRPGVSGDSAAWESQGHGRDDVEEVHRRAA